MSHYVVKHPIHSEMRDCGGKRKCFASYRLVSPVDANEEEEFCHKEADAQVLVNRVAVTLQPTEEAEGEDADQEADQWEQDANPRDKVQEQVMDCIAVLEIKQTKKSSVMCCMTSNPSQTQSEFVWDPSPIICIHWPSCDARDQ